MHKHLKPETKVIKKMNFKPPDFGGFKLVDIDRVKRIENHAFFIKFDHLKVGHFSPGKEANTLKGISKQYWVKPIFRIDIPILIK